MANWSIFGTSKINYTESEIFYIILIFLAIFIPIYILVINKSSPQSIQQLIVHTQKSIIFTQKNMNNIRAQLKISELSSSQNAFLNAQLTSLKRILEKQIDYLNALNDLNALNAN